MISCIEFWDWVSNIGSLASIIALPITLWQLHDVKSKIAVSQDSMKKMLKLTEHDKIELIQKSLNTQHDILVQLRATYSRPGSKWETTVEAVNGIIVELNGKEHDLPTDYSIEANQLRDTVKQLTDFITCNETDRDFKLKDAELNLHNCIQNIKKKLEHGGAEKIKIIAGN